jgi:General secretion pathway protein M.
MKPRERQLVLFAGILFALVLILRVVPALVGYYQQGREDIALLEERIARYQALAAATAEWQERAQLKNIEVSELQSWIFQGSDANLIGNSVQRSLRAAVERSNLGIREMSVARYNYVGDWLMVTQDMNFTLNQEDILPFLNALQELRPRLFVQSFTITRNRRQYTGSITVTAFGRVQANAAARR